MEDFSNFDWIEDVELTMSVCEAYNRLRIGDTITIDKLTDWNDWEFYDVKAEVIEIDICNEIHENNKSSQETILIHVDEVSRNPGRTYAGFDRHWTNDFYDERSRDLCRDGKCMFIICGIDEISISLVNSINESAGISFEPRKWGDIVYDEITSNPQEKTRIIIDGYDHPNAFEKFPIDYVVIDFYDKVTGYSQEHSGYDKDGNYVVLLYIQPKLIQGQGGFSLKTVLNHELKHAWEDYSRISKGYPNIEQTKESREFYTKDFIKLMSNQSIVGPIKDILKYYYYISNLEKGPYMENVYDENIEYEKVIREIMSKDFEQFKDRFDLNVNWHLINTNYDIPFIKKFKSPTNFIDYSSSYLKKRALKILKKINKMKYVHKKL